MKYSDMGSAVISPEGTFRAGANGTWTLRYTVGKYGIDDGGSIIITRRAMSDAGLLQCERPEDPGYTTAITNGDAALRIWYDNRYWIRPYRGAIVAHVFDGSLTCGDTITVTIGDRSSGSPGWTLQTFPETKHTFRVLVDAFGTREYYPLTVHPSITLVPGEPHAIDAVVPSTAVPGQEIPLHVRIVDSWGNPAGSFIGEVSISCTDNGIDYEKTVTMQSDVEVADTIRIEKEGLYCFSVQSDGMKGSSNPVVVSQNRRRVYWADLHGQTEATVGTGTVGEYFSFARDKALMDAAGWQGNDFQVRDVDWEDVCRETKAFHEPEKFITFSGYEWSGLTPAGGDHNILFLNDDEPIRRSSHWQIHDGSSDESDCYPLSDLWEAFRGRTDMMAIAHVGGRYANLDYWDDDFSGLVEIHSHHGTFEWIAKDALRRGLITGFVGQSDDHTGRPGLSAPLRPLARDFATFDVYGGYTGIFAEKLTRRALWDALRARHCYATTGTRIVLDIRSGDNMMGDIVTRPGPVKLAVAIAGTAPLLDVEVLRDTDVIYRYPFALDSDNTWVRIEWSGVRIKSRSKTADWDGSISVDGGEITDFRPYAFDRDDQGVSRLSENELEVASSTSGDIDGVFLKVSGKSPVITFDNPMKAVKASLLELGAEPVMFDVGGVNLQVRMSLCSPDNRPDSISVTVRDGESRSERCAYWVKVVQVDGHMAWSSPIYFIRS